MSIIRVTQRVLKGHAKGAPHPGEWGREGCFQEIAMPAEPKGRLAFCTYMDTVTMKFSPNT